MKLSDFIAIAEYGNEMWNGSFTTEEVRENAEIYYADLLWSKENGIIAESIKSLCRNLADDLKCMSDLEQPREWLYKIAEELGLFDMDTMDYAEIDSTIIEIFLAK